MKRREFLTAGAAASVAPGLLAQALCDEPDRRSKPGAKGGAACHCTYATPAEAMKAPPETLAYVPAIYVGTGVNKPDYLATVDVDPKSSTYSQVVHRLPMPNVGDELHHYGWNACSSCHGDPTKKRRYLVVPGLHSGRIHIIDTAEPAAPKFRTTIEPAEIVRKTRLTTPHTVHCTPDGRIMISMLGDAEGNAPGGFLLLDEKFNIAGRWERSTEGMHFNYDYWYQPRQGVMVSSEWAAPNTVKGGFKPEDVAAGKYGRRLLFWDWKSRELKQTLDLGPEGIIPLEVRFHHNPDSSHGFVGAALSSTIWHWHKRGDRWGAEKVIAVEPRGEKPMPGLITDIVLSLDDRYLYFSCWLHGEIRQYDVADPAKPKLTGRIDCGGLPGIGRPTKVRGRTLTGGPQMLQLSRDGKRLYVTSSLYSVWDNQFYPDIAKRGSYMLQIDCDTGGGMKINDRFFVDFGREPAGPARAHEIRFPSGDCTSDIWV